MTTTIPAPQAVEYACQDVGVRLPGRDSPRDVLAGVDIVIKRSSIATVVGRSGVGKTTFLRLLAGFTAASTGALKHRGRVVEGPLDGVVTVFQDYTHALLSWRTVGRNVSLGLEAQKIPRAERHQRVNEALTMVGLADVAEEYPWRLSGGMQQRVQIARALAVRPKVLLMDEPFGALDSMTKANLQDQLLSVRDSTACTIVFITHDVEEAVYLGDTVVVMDGQPGTITQSVEVDLPYPRDQLTTRELPRYLAIRHQLYAALRGENDG